MSSAMTTMSSATIALATTTTYKDFAAFLAATGKPGVPPPGVTAHPMGPNPNGVFMVFLNVVALLLCTTITAMRLWTKGVLLRSMGWDDYTCIITLIGIYVWAIAQFRTVQLGWCRHSYDIRTNNGSSMLKGKFDFIGQDVYLFSIGCVKVSILLMYLRTFTGNKSFKWTVRGLICLIICVHTVAFLGWTLSIIPVWCHWTYWPSSTQYGETCHHPAIQKINVPYSLFLNSFTVVMDLVIIYLPIRPVWQLQLAKRQRISILVIMSAGVIVTIASIVRLGYYIRGYYHGTIDSSWTNCRINWFSTIELGLAQICCCLPTLKPFTRKYMPGLLRLKSYAGRSKDRSTAHPAATTQHTTKIGRKWPDGSRDEGLIGSTYLELGEDGKSDQSYVMSPMASAAVKEGKR